MTATQTFEFSDSSVARDYDDVLVPLLFEPWATELLEEHSCWEGRAVLDLATGTGVVARLLGEKVGPGGHVVAADINAEMLSIARRRCAAVASSVSLIESPAHPLELSSECVDVVVCQQGFQFFPDRRAAASEIFRVLRPGGRALVSTWRCVEECELFGAICGALNDVGEHDIAEKMRVPFDFMPEEELVTHFGSAGFVGVEVKRRSRDLVPNGGREQAVDAAYATPIAQQLRALPEAQQVAFGDALKAKLADRYDGGRTMGRMVTNLLIAEKPS